MKTLSLHRVVTTSLLILVPFAGFAATNTDLISDLQKVLDQYKERIQQLEAENALLQKVMAENGIQIPLGEYMNAMNMTGATTTTGALIGNTSSVSSSTVDLSSLPSDYRGFIEQIHKNWEGIKWAYNLDSTAKIAWYEFVQSGNYDHVFVDILYDKKTTAWAYNIKILYQYDKTTFARKLIGLFEFSDTQKAFVTRTGSNPFASIERKFIADPYMTPASSSPSVPSTPDVSGTPSDVIAKIAAAYQNDQYDTVISLTDAYLKDNAPTFEVLHYKYRNLFIVKRYTDSLDTIKQMETLGMANNVVYCDAYAVALYAGNTTLANSYKSKAGDGCKTITP